MKHSLILILFLTCFGVLSAQDTKTSLVVSCGDWIQITATPLEGYHFVKWSDEDTAAVRQVQINEDTHFIAFFATACGDYANLPIVTLYDWLLMLDVRAVQNQGYYFREDNVSWYRVVGEIDSLDHPTFPDDEFVCKGYYLTLDKNLLGTGDYYAVVDVSGSPTGVMCVGLMRTIIAHYTQPQATSRMALYPTHAVPRQSLKLVGLNPNQTTHIYVYDMVGKMLLYTTSSHEATCALSAMEVPGCYNVVVRCGDESQTLRYIVHQ